MAETEPHKTLLPPAVAADQSPLKVPRIRRDVGAAWARGLKIEQIGALADLAAQLTAHVRQDPKFPPWSGILTEDSFFQRLGREGASQARDRICQIVGYAGDTVVDVYTLWWCSVWVDKFITITPDDGEDRHEATAERLRVPWEDARDRLARKDVQKMIGVLLEACAKDAKGYVDWRTTEGALAGNPKHAQLYYDKVVGQKSGGDGTTGTNFDRMNEEELVAVIARMRRKVGEPFEEHKQIDMKDAEFEAEEPE